MICHGQREMQLEFVCPYEPSELVIVIVVVVVVVVVVFDSEKVVKMVVDSISLRDFGHRGHAYTFLLRQNLIYLS